MRFPHASVLTESSRVGLFCALASIFFACASDQGSRANTGDENQNTTAAGATSGSSQAGATDTSIAGGGVPSGTAGAEMGGSTSSTAGATMGGSSQGGSDMAGSATMGGSSPAGGGMATADGGVGGSAEAGGSEPAGGDMSTAGTGVAGSVETGAAGAGGDTGTGASCSSLPPTDDYGAPGPFETTIDTDVGPSGDFTVFRPVSLGENGFLHPPIIFEPGIGGHPLDIAGFLTHFATHGFVLASTGVPTGGPNDPGNLSKMQAVADWILGQNDEPGIYQGKLDVTHAVSMGFSVGGTAAVEFGAHEAVATTVSIHGHVATSALHGPLLQTSGTEDTVGRPMQQQTFDMSQVQTFFGVVSGAGHLYIGSDDGGVQRPAITAWIRYWICNDTDAADYFYGDDCVMCTDPWTGPQRKNWQ